MIGWLAIKERIGIDWEYEQELEPKGPAYRSVPIDLVPLNDSFERQRLAVARDSPAGKALVWKPPITRSDSAEPLREWTMHAEEVRAFEERVARTRLSATSTGRRRRLAMNPAVRQCLPELLHAVVSDVRAESTEVHPAGAH